MGPIAGGGITSLLKIVAAMYQVWDALYVLLHRASCCCGQLPMSRLQVACDLIADASIPAFRANNDPVSRKMNKRFHSGRFYTCV